MRIWVGWEMWDSLRSPPCRAISSCWAHLMTTLSMHTWSMMVAWTFHARRYQELEECENWVSRKMSDFYIGECFWPTKLINRNLVQQNYVHPREVSYLHICALSYKYCLRSNQTAELLSPPVFSYSFSSNSSSTAASSLPTASNKSFHMCVCVVWIAKVSIESLWC